MADMVDQHHRLFCLRCIFFAFSQKFPVLQQEARLFFDGGHIGRFYDIF